MLILKFRKYNNSLYKLSSDFQIVTVLGLQFIIFILQQLHNLITTALLGTKVIFSSLRTKSLINHVENSNCLTFKFVSETRIDQIREVATEIYKTSKL